MGRIISRPKVDVSVFFLSCYWTDYGPKLCTTITDSIPLDCVISDFAIFGHVTQNGVKKFGAIQLIF